MSITADTPIYMGTINGRAVRFFRGPGDEPDMPWHAHEDLLASFGIPRALRRTLRAQVLKHWPQACRTVEVEGEPVLLAPHFVGQGIISASSDASFGIAEAPKRVERDYYLAGTEALKVLTAGLPTAEERTAWAFAAFRNQGGTGGGAP